MKYIEFKIYIKKIILYQAQNKKHRHWTIGRRCELNFTTRQLAKLCNVSHVTISRWLKKLRGEGIIKVRRYVNTKFNSMVFFTHLEVFNILKAIAKKRAYNFVKRKIKDCKNVTLKIYNNIYNNKKWNLKLNCSLNNKDFMLMTENGWLSLDQIDLRTKNMERRKASKKELSDFFLEMGKMLA